MWKDAAYTECIYTGSAQLVRPFATPRLSFIFCHFSLFVPSWNLYYFTNICTMEKEPVRFGGCCAVSWREKRPLLQTRDRATVA